MKRTLKSKWVLLFLVGAINIPDTPKENVSMLAK